MEFYESGFGEFAELLKEFDVNEGEVLNVMEKGARSYIQDVRKLPRPRSRMNAPGYTHLLDTVTYRRNKQEIEIGWGKYYGPMLEHGAMRMTAVPHIGTTFERNKGKYYKTMVQELFGKFV
ncbi:MAG: hypothetical protein KHY34_13050 [Lachnospiraceae bacterium]|nr:hypothetical protein [Lachnospiraceae bacterium]